MYGDGDHCLSVFLGEKKVANISKETKNRIDLDFDTPVEEELYNAVTEYAKTPIEERVPKLHTIFVKQFTAKSKTGDGIRFIDENRYLGRDHGNFILVDEPYNLNDDLVSRAETKVLKDLGALYRIEEVTE